ncbi:MAG: molybdenum cofactor guanylyltransferase [Actinomycetota bacterium]
MNQNNFTGFVLAGGKSSRMGADKFALELHGETFLTRAVNALSPVCGIVKIVLNEHQTIETEQPIVRDIYTLRGALGAVHAALKNCETKLAIILAVDLPFVTTEAIENLANIALSSNKFIAFVPSQTDDKPQPLCAVYRAKYCLPTLEKLLNENDSASVRDFLDLIFPKYIEADRLSADKNLLFNVNQPNHFQQLQNED